MHLEELSKSQIMLLALLVSFVTSIATGIVTVSLMEQAPPVVAQTVNRVVERTVERIVPSQVASAVVTETVIVKESELIAQAVAKIEPSIVRLFSVGKDIEGKDIETFLGVGVVVSSDGVIVTDAAAVSALPLTIASAGGTRSGVTVLSTDETAGLAFLRAATTTGSTASLWMSARVRQSEVSLGETVVGMTGKLSRIATGIVTALPETRSATGTPHFFETDIDGMDLAKGSVLIDTDGSVVGLSTAASRALSASAFLASEEIVYTITDKTSISAQ